MPTVTTVPLILLFALLWRLTGGQILAMVAFVSVFSAASALDFGSLGVSPWLFVLGAGLVVKFIQGHGTYRLTPGLNRTALWLVMVFLAYASWTGIAYPLLFAGTPVVRTVAEEPLAWGMSNFAQLCYLLAAAVLYLLALGSTRAELRLVLRWYVRGCIVASCFAMYQLANAVTHIPYPSEVLYSNKAHVIYSAYMINGVWRLNSTFSEASEMAGVLIVGVALLGWDMVTLPFRITRMLSLVLMLVSLLMTVSSVGYICLGFLVLIGSALGIRYVVKQGSLSIQRVIFALLLMLGTLTVFTLQPAARDTVGKVIQSTLLEKQNTESYRNRTLTHSAALHTLENTAYMGAGWGSARASGLLYVLLATVGIPGVVLFLAFLGALVLPLFRAKRPASPALQLATSEQGQQYEQALLGLCVLVLSLVVAGAEPVDPVLWILFGIATVARAPVAERRQLAVAGPAPALIPWSPLERHSSFSPL